jgi:hypothetical protein
MKSPTKSPDAVTVILEFVELQDNLISAFREAFPQIADWEYLLDCPKSGDFWALEEEWEFHRHGAGICFTGQKSGKVVDAHWGISSSPRAFDAWRLSQYFESIGIETIGYLSDVFEVCDEDGAEALLNSLLKDGEIATAFEPRKLYTLKE